MVQDSEFPALVDLLGVGDCIGTLITTRHLLTVAHCAEDLETSQSLQVAGTAHGIATITLHPQWVDWDYDIAVVALEEPVADVTPYPLFTGTDEQGQLLTLVGRGLHATGLQGEPGASTDGLLRRATNLVASTSEQWLEVRFEAPGSGESITDLEGVGAAGDSGGPAFIGTGEGLQVAGLNSWGEPPAGGAIGQYGGSDYSTRVSSFAEWIQEQTSSSPGGNASGADNGCACADSSPAANWFPFVLLLGLAQRRRSAL